MKMITDYAVALHPLKGVMLSVARPSATSFLSVKNPCWQRFWWLVPSKLLEIPFGVYLILHVWGHVSIVMASWG